MLNPDAKPKRKINSDTWRFRKDTAADVAENEERAP